MTREEKIKRFREWMATKDQSGRILIRAVGHGCVRVKPGVKLIEFYLSPVKQ